MHKWSNDEIPILQLGEEFYSPVKAADFKQTKLRYWNNTTGLNGFDKNLFHSFSALEPNNLQQNLALKYHGHQFMHYNPELGDGRGFLYAQIKKDNHWYDLGTKGSGQTPYSRKGDGRLTLKGAVREALATEMLETLHVNTSKTQCIFETFEDLIRYDEPSPTRSGVLTRYSDGHIRVGTFQRLGFNKEIENIKKLTEYSLFFYYHDTYLKTDFENELHIASQLLNAFTSKLATLAAEVMMAGFVHGVLNTDNINISAELFDYGPYRFLPQYDPNFTAAYFDESGLYCYGRQPAAFFFTLEQLAATLKLAYPDLPTEEITGQFSELFGEAIRVCFLKRLNLKTKGSEEDQRLLGLFFENMRLNNLFFEKTFFEFNSKKVLNNNPDNSSNELLKALERYELADLDKKNQQAQLQTLLIDEIETIWDSIDKQDDWSLFYKKINDLRISRGSITLEHL